MPFRSEKQRRFLWAKHPDIAKRWTAEYGSTPQPSDGQGQKHSGSYKGLTPGPKARHTPFRASEQEATREGPVELTGRPGPLGAASRASGFRGRDRRAAAKAKITKGKA